MQKKINEFAQYRTLNNFSVNTGKMGKFYKKYLPVNLYNLYYKTYSDGNYNNFWDSIFTACKLFKLIALNVGKYFNFEYNQNEENGVTEYLKWVKNIWLKGDEHEF